MSNEEETVTHKSHRERNAGRKAEKKKLKKEKQQVITDKQKNPKAFTFNSAVKAERRFRRKQDLDTKKTHIPLVDRTPLEPPPILVAIVGPPKVGKTLLIQCLIKSYTKLPMLNIQGPVTMVSGKKRRVTFIECNNDINSMIDIAKVADLVLLLIDASFGFEMEVFEFLNICQVHGMPRIMGVLTHLDCISNIKQMRKIKKILKHRFWTEVYAGAKLFYLSGLIHNEYLRNEIKNLSRFIAVMKFRPLTWRTTHPYLLADRVEDLTPPETIRQNPKVDRTISLYGYIRGVPLIKESSVHIAGCGDLRIKDISFLPDPCPLPEQIKKRALVEKERLIYAPFSGVGGVVYDKDAVYVELGGSHSHKVSEDGGIVSEILKSQDVVDENLEKRKLKLFSEADPIKSRDIEKTFGESYAQENVFDNGRLRRKVVFNDNEEDKKDSEEENDQDDSENDEEDEELNKNNQDISHNKRKAPLDKDAEKNVKKIKNEDLDELINESTISSGSIIKKNKMEQDFDDDESFDELSDGDVDGKVEQDDDDREEIEDDDDDDDDDETNKTISKQKKEVVFRGLIQNPHGEIKNKISEVLKNFGTVYESNKSKNNSVDDENNEIKQDCQNENSKEDEYDDDSENEDMTDDEENDNSENEDMTDDEENDNSENENDHNDEEDENNFGSSKWKENLAEKAREDFLARQQSNVNWMKIVYGVAETKEEVESTEEEKENDDDNEDIGGIFRVISKQQKQKLEERERKNQEDSVFYSRDTPRNWLSTENKFLITNRFVTGQWKESEDAEQLLKLDDLSEDDEEVFGDFEDLETGEKMTAQPKPPEEKDADEIEEKKRLLEKKLKLKQQFLEELNNSESKTFYDDLKQEAETQAQLNKSEFEGLDDNLRVQLEGFRPGMYIRIEFEAVPCELITNFDPTYPLIVGGLLHGEENIGFVQVRIKKHRWYPKILKTRDPLILSVGWRRFQTLPIFSKLEDNMRHRMLKYTPEHVACMGHFWGPITPPGTGILAIQDIATRTPGFRIAATGSVVELDKSTRIVKKLKLTGVPMKIYKKTAFIKDMFNSKLEVAKFEGAKIKTVSGIRGQIKKANSKPEGSFRATFEDKILLSDIVFCRTWYKVDVPKFYNPVNSLLLPIEAKNQWRGMKTTGQLKREKGIKAVPNEDSLYKPIERQPKVFKPLAIPKTLQKELPYRDKPKLKPLPEYRRPKFSESRVAVVRGPKEEHVAKLMKMIRVAYQNKQEKLKEAMHKRMTEHQAQVEAEEMRKLKRQKELKKQIHRTLSKMDAKEKNKKH
ncbi:ribosome biogenesis protein BMS1 homolog [Chelonus insularis]|uniref:ribosome biogenesis protein BMS1 homolog n=1 Tax=Chelonus insularis TaxID=460826 RepID=UPI0015898490|nr:ribosome biogenesis protein BMS1 homolog [Chelonus insularis]